MIKERIYSLCGVSWFVMDVFWFWKFHYLSAVFAAITLVSCISGLFIYNASTKGGNHYVALATTSWLLLNICALCIDMFPEPEYSGVVFFAKFLGFVFSFIGAQSVLALAIDHRDVFNKFKRL